MIRNPFVTRMLWALVLVVAFACKKTSEATPDAPTLLMAHSWKVDKVLANNNPLTTDLINSYAGKDGLEVFNLLYNSDILLKSDGTWVGTDRTTSLATTGTWKLESRNQKQYLTLQANLDSTPTPYEFEVVTLTSTKLSLTRVFEIPVTAGFFINTTIQLDMIPAS